MGFPLFYAVEVAFYKGMPESRQISSRKKFQTTLLTMLEKYSPEAISLAKELISSS